jgi:uncharacterized UPF0160 family protein
MANNKEVTIVAHSSGFHTDDIFAVATLSLLLEKDHEIKIVRTRSMDFIEKADYVVDVGGIHDESKNRFDHHQEGGAGKRENGIPYASFGLVWKKYGEELSGSYGAFEKIDKTFVQPIDSGDNGLQFLETKIPGLGPFDVQLITSIFVPTWKEDTKDIDDIFLKLVSYAKFLMKRIIVSTKDRVEGEKFVIESYNNSSDKRLVILNNSRYPWEESLSKFPEPLFVIYENISDNTWSIKGIRENMFSYTPRKKLPEAWAGKRDEELDNITGVSGGVFCHNARFMAVAKTKEAILKMAQIALNS